MQWPALDLTYHSNRGLNPAISFKQYSLQLIVSILSLSLLYFLLPSPTLSNIPTMFLYPSLLLLDMVSSQQKQANAAILS